MGNLGADPEVRYTQGGSVVANFHIATSEQWTDKQSGQRQERTEWHRIVVFGKQAETCGEYLHKGRSVFVEGRIQTREWEDKDGNRRFTTEVIADRVLFMGGKGEGATNRQGPPQNGNQNAGRPAGNSRPRQNGPRQNAGRGGQRQPNFPPPGNEPPPLEDADVPW